MKLPEGLGPFEPIVAASMALAAARELIARGEGSLAEVAALEEALEEAAYRLVTEPTRTPASAIDPALLEADRAGSEKLARWFERDGKL